MTRGAGPGLKRLFRDLGDRVAFVSVYVREAHPGERYPRHERAEQKIRHARDWAIADNIPWPVAVDTLDGDTHRSYGPLPNSAYLIDVEGRVAFRALWAGHERLLRRKLRRLLAVDGSGVTGSALGERRPMLVPLLHGGAETIPTLRRAGRKALHDFREEMGVAFFAAQRLLSGLRPVIHRDPRLPAPAAPVRGAHYAALIGGVTGAAAMSAFTASARRSGSRLDFEALLGTADAKPLTAARWWTGFALQLLNGGLLAQAYAAAFWYLGRDPGWAGGAALGVAHGLASAPLLAATRRTHPGVRRHHVKPPARALDFAIAIASHLVYGTIVGLALSRSARRLAVPGTAGCPVGV
jgi:hypothetical protein